MTSRVYDVAIIGGGIVGLATALELTQRHPSRRIAILEKESAVAVHQTGHNSGVVHSGIYYRPGSQKALFCVGGKNDLLRFCQENEIDVQLCGKVIVATEESELGRLDDLYQRGTTNGVEGLEVIGPERLKEIEPNVQGIKALYAPKSGIVDFTKVSQRYADKVLTQGGEIHTQTRVVGLRRGPSSLSLETTRGPLEANHLINCAGLHADRVARMMGAPGDVRIVPFRGEYFTLRPESQGIVKGMIYPVPDPRFPFLGIHFTRNIHGGVDAGPNAVLAGAREGYRKSSLNPGDLLGMLAFPGFWAMSAKYWKIGLGEMYRSLSKRVFVRDLQKLVPAVQEADLAPGGAGVRAQAVDRAGRVLDDFSIKETDRAIHVLNAPSPGATSSLAIGRYIADLAESSFGLGR